MIFDWLFSAGQALSAIGLAYGAYLSITGGRAAEAVRNCADSSAMLHDLRTA